MQLVRTQAAVLGRERAARALTKRPAAVLPGPHARGGGAPRLKVGVVAHVARRLRPAAQRRQASGSTLPRTRAPPPTPDRGARTCCISPVHVRRQTLHGSSASPIFVTVYEASQTGIARRSVRASSTSAAHTRMRRLVTGAGASSQSKGVTSSADARVGKWKGRHGVRGAGVAVDGTGRRRGGARRQAVRCRRLQRRRRWPRLGGAVRPGDGCVGGGGADGSGSRKPRSRGARR